MKTMLLFFVSLISSGSYQSDTLLYDSAKVKPENIYTPINVNFVERGEELKYNISFGWFSIGEATMKVQKNNYRVNHRDCFKVDIYGKTSGMVDWVAKVDDHWGAYVDSSALVTHIAYRNIKEGRYRRNEITRFDHVTDNIEVKILDQKTREFMEPMYYQAKDNMRDMIGGFFYLRSVDYSKKVIGDTIKVSGFFEDTFYDMEILYKGKEEVKTKMGKFSSLKLVPVMPNNSLFDGENSITVWLSDDKNKVPVKVEANMFIGHAGIELINVDNIKHELNVEKKNNE